MNSLTQRRDATPSRRLVGASILAADFANLGQDARTALEAGADFLHVDVMDGHFVPNLSMGPEICRGLRKAMPEVIQDVHLMVQYPEQYFERFRDAGADHITLHAEVIEPGRAAEVADDRSSRALGWAIGSSPSPHTTWCWS
jgi:ribulose-phosphate 3-epimerase